MTSDKRSAIGLIGRKGSGKGTVAKILHKEYGAVVFRYSDLLREILTILSIPQSRENLITLSETARDKFGQDVLQKAMSSRVRGAAQVLVVIDGLRRAEDLPANLGELKLISVDAPLEIRYERIRQRGENVGETAFSLDQFREEELAPTEVTIGEIEHLAWRHIDNSGDHEQLRTQIQIIMKELGYENPHYQSQV